MSERKWHQGKWYRYIAQVYRPNRCTDSGGADGDYSKDSKTDDAVINNAITPEKGITYSSNGPLASPNGNDKSPALALGDMTIPPPNVTNPPEVYILTNPN